MSTYDKGLKWAMAAVGGLFLLASVRSARADVIDQYTFSAGSTITFADGNVETVTGGFSYDVTNPSHTTVNVTLSGSGPEAQSYSYPAGAEPDQVAAANNEGVLLFLNFDTDLGGAVVELGGARFDPFTPIVNATSVSGSVELPVTTPEPRVAGMVGVGLGLCVVARQRFFRRRVASQ